MRTLRERLGTNTRPPRSASSRGPSGGRGFSLVELVLVIAVIVVVAAVAAPRWGTASARYRADALARRIAADLDRTRQAAMARGVALGVNFDVSANAYRIAGAGDLDRRSDSSSLDLSQGPYHGRLTRVDFGGGNVAAFNGFGVPIMAGEAQVAVGTESRLIELEADTGIVRVYRLGASVSDPLTPVREFLYAVDGPRIDTTVGDSGVSITVGGQTP